MIVLSLLPPLIWAGSISLQIQTEVTPQKPGWLVTLKAANEGSDTAFNLRAVVRLGDGKESSQVSALPLHPGTSEAFHFRLTDEPKMAGQYPLFVAVDYTDANRYPFTALSFNIVNHRQSQSPAVFAVLENVELGGGSETMRLKIRNLGADAKRVEARLFLPNEISAKESSQNVALEPNAEVSVPFVLHRFSALPGSTYPIYAVIQYESGQEHFCVPATGIVKVVENKNGLLRTGAAALALVLASLWGFRAYRAAP